MTDRRALGGEAYYTQDYAWFSSLVDYDIFYNEMNLIIFNMDGLIYATLTRSTITPTPLHRDRENAYSDNTKASPSSAHAWKLSKREGCAEG